MLAAYTEASARAVNNLRSASHFQWYIVPILAFVVYVYVVEAEKRNYNTFMAGLAFLTGEFAWETFNALVLHWSNRSAMWTAPADSAYLILVGLNIEICLMFAVAGVLYAKALPDDRSMKILKIPNRLFLAVAFGVGCVLVEVVLNRWGALAWEYPWWRWPNIWLIIVAYTVGFGLTGLFYDLRSTRQKVSIICGLFAMDVAFFIVFAVLLKWI